MKMQIACSWHTLIRGFHYPIKGIEQIAAVERGFVEQGLKHDHCRLTTNLLLSLTITFFDQRKLNTITQTEPVVRTNGIASERRESCGDSVQTVSTQSDNGEAGATVFQRAGVLSRLVRPVDVEFSPTKMFRIWECFRKWWLKLTFVHPFALSNGVATKRMRLL